MPVITPGDRDYLSNPSLLKEISKKNFIRENIKFLKQIEKKNRKEAIKKLEQENEIYNCRFPRRNFGKSRSQAKLIQRRLLASSSSKSIVKSIPVSPTTQVEYIKPLKSGSSGKKKNRARKEKRQAIKAQAQKLDRGDGTESTEEDFVTTCIQNEKENEEKLKQSTDNQNPSFSPFNIEDIKREMKAVQDVDFIKLNQLVQYKPKKNEKNEKHDPTKPPPTYKKGVLPKYLREQKKETDTTKKREPTMGSHLQQTNNETYRDLNRQIQNKRGREVDMYNPQMEILLSEAERKQQLNDMRKHYAELINKINQLPINADTQRGRQLKTELEKELQTLEAGISLFSKDKLFVKIS